MELNVEQASEEESSQGGVSDTDDVGSVSVPVDDEGFETLAAEIKEVLAELAQVRGIFETIIPIFTSVSPEISVCRSHFDVTYRIYRQNHNKPLYVLFMKGESVADSVIQATGMVQFEDGLRTGVHP